MIHFLKLAAVIAVSSVIISGPLQAAMQSVPALEVKAFVGIGKNGKVQTYKEGSKKSAERNPECVRGPSYSAASMTKGAANAKLYGVYLACGLAGLDFGGTVIWVKIDSVQMKDEAAWKAYRASIGSRLQCRQESAVARAPGADGNYARGFCG